MSTYTPLNSEMASSSYPDAETRRRTVLVAVMNNAEDLHRAATEGWYRVPQRRAPRRIGADYLAFYQTGAFKGQPEAQTVTYYAPTRRYRLLTRGELMPEEANHSRAEEYYFRIDIGPLQRLERPVPSGKFRRVTFIHTTLDRLLNAEDIRGLFYTEDPFDKLWKALHEHGLRPLQNRVVNEMPMDITLRARGGYLGIRCPASSTEESRIQETQRWVLPERWELLQISLSSIEQNLDSCLQTIGAALINLGGSVLNQK